MTKREKRLLRIRQNPKNVQFDELHTIIEEYGFVLKRSSGSHHSFQVKVGDEDILLVIPYARPIGTAYVREAIKLIDEIIRLSENQEKDEHNDS